MVPNRAVDGWSALADETRRAIVSRLAEKPLPVGQLAAGLPVTRSAVSQHLKILKDAGLVSERAVGTRRIYRLNPTAVAALRDQLDAFWRRALEGYADVADPPKGHRRIARRAAISQVQGQMGRNR